MQCINITHPEYIDLENNSSAHPDALKAMISVWMDNNPNEDRYPTLDELGIPQKELFKKVSKVKASEHTKAISDRIKKDLPKEVEETITFLEEVPIDVLGREDLFLSLKDILNDNGVYDEVLINWLGVNKDRVGSHPSTFKSEQQVSDFIQKIYDKKKKVDNHIELKTNKLALESFRKWVNALEKYPIAFRELMLTHAIKQLNPQRRSKYVLQLSDIALTQTYGILTNKPHEANRIGKLYDSEVLKTVSDAVGHEPSASGDGYWVHIPRTDNSKKPLGAKDYEEFKRWAEYNIKSIQEGIPKIYSSGVFWHNPELFSNYGITNFNTEEKAISKSLEEVEKNKKLLEEVSESNFSNSQFKVNVELLRKLSPSTWCTAGGMASHYVENYDNYLLIVNGVTVAGIEAYPEEHSQDRETLLKKISLIEQHIENGVSQPEQHTDLEKYKRLLSVEKDKIRVKEVTSRSNNGVASIDHYDDIFAFFEKHNLDTNNTTLKRAKAAKDLGKKDAEVVELPDNVGEWVDENGHDENRHIDGFNGEHEIDPLEYEEFFNNEDPDEIFVSEITTVENAKEVFSNQPNFLRYFNTLNTEIKKNEDIARLGVSYDSHNIANIDVNMPFYDELATMAVTKNPYIFQYLPTEKKELPGLRDTYNAFERERELVNVWGDDLPFSKTSVNKIQGYYDSKKDKVVLITSNINENESSKVGIHEVAHRGMIRMAKELGGMEELNQILLNSEKELMKKLPELLNRTGHKNIEELTMDYGFDSNTKEGKSKLLMELAARWAETLVNVPKPSWWKEFLTSIQKWISKFVGKDLSEKEVNALVGGFVKYGTKQQSESKTRILNLSKANEVLEGSYPSEISEKQISIIKGKISKINNELAKNGVKRTYKIENVRRVKGKEAFTWKLQEIDEFLNVEEKIARTYNPDLNKLNSAKAYDLGKLAKEIDLFTNKVVENPKEKYIFIDMQTHDYEIYKNYIYLNNTPIGTMTLSNDGTHFNVESVSIKGAYQRQGVGTSVYKYMGNWAEENGLRLRSHIERHESSEGMWKKLAKQGLASLYNERYYFGEQNKTDESGQLDLFYKNNQDDIDSMKIIISC